MQAKQRPVASNKTAQAKACLTDAAREIENRNLLEAELALVEYVRVHRGGLREGALNPLDELAVELAADLFEIRHGEGRS